MYTGSNGGVTSHHLTIIPAKPLTTAPMNSSNVTTCGYAGSEMVKAVDRTTATDGNGDCTKLPKDETGLGAAGSTLHEIYDQYIEPDFTDHVLEYSNLLTNKMTETLTNRYGSATGASSNWGWYPRKLDLMSEMNVYGGIVTSSSMYDTGIDNRQYAIFRLKPEFINSYGGKQFQYWLKDVATSTVFANVGSSGNAASDGSAGTQFGVRPRFLIG